MKYSIIGALAFWITVYALWDISPIIAIPAGFGAILAAWLWLYVLECAAIVKREEM